MRKRRCGVAGCPVLIGFGKKLFPVLGSRCRHEDSGHSCDSWASTGNVNRRARQTAATHAASAAVWRRAGGLVGRFSRSFLDRLRILYGDRWARRCRRNWPAGVRQKCDMLCHCKLGLVNAALYGMPNSRKTGQIRREVREEVRLFRCLDTKGVREIYH